MKMPSFTTLLFRKVDGSSVALFRIAFGVIMLWEALRYFQLDWIHPNFVEPQFFFQYYGFDWIHPLSESGMNIVFFLWAVLSICIALGFHYRISILSFFLLFTYVFLIDQARYLNHFYLIILISFLLVFIPAHTMLSIDAKRKPSLHAQLMPFWTLFLLRFQLGIVYVYGGIAKLNYDWLLRGEPMGIWLSQKTDYPIVGKYFTERWMVMGMSWSGMLIDLFIVPLLLYRRTRGPAFIVLILFNLINASLFDIGIFPWFMIAASTLFFDAGWTNILFKKYTYTPEEGEVKPWVVMLITVFCGYNLLFPLRHFLYPSNVYWSTEGSRFAWHMKISQRARWISFYIGDNRKEFDITTNLTSDQIRRMTVSPDMVLQYAHWLSGLHNNAPVYVSLEAAMNGRKRQYFIDPHVDLSKERRNLAHAEWIVPLESL